MSGARATTFLEDGELSSDSSLDGQADSNYNKMEVDAAKTDERTSADRSMPNIDVEDGGATKRKKFNPVPVSSQVQASQIQAFQADSAQQH